MRFAFAILYMETVSALHIHVKGSFRGEVPALCLLATRLDLGMGVEHVLRRYRGIEENLRPWSNFSGPCPEAPPLADRRDREPADPHEQVCRFEIRE
jgi:hypothetical protein